MKKLRQTMPSKKKVFEYWNQDENTPDFAVDGFPDDQCFACGDPGQLDRAHIKAAVNGGTNSANNLNMLCKPCHVDSELFTGKAYWTWLSYKYIHGYDFGYSRRKHTVAVVIAFAKEKGITDFREAYKEFINLKD